MTEETDSGVSEKQSRRVSSWMLLMVSILVGLGVCVATFSVNRLRSQTPQAVATVILDETQTHWPFYKSSHEQARVIVEDRSTFQSAAATLADPSQALSLSVQPSSELSIFSIIATAETDAAAVALATASANELQRRSADQRQEPSAVRIQDLEAEIRELESEQTLLSLAVDAESSESEAIKNRAELTQTSERLGEQRNELTDAQQSLATTSSAYKFLGPAVLDQPATQSVVASLAAGAGAAVLALLMFSFFSAPSNED